MEGKSVEISVTPKIVTQEKLRKLTNIKKRITRAATSAMIGVSSLIGGRDTLPSPTQTATNPSIPPSPSEVISKSKMLEEIRQQLQATQAEKKPPHTEQKELHQFTPKVTIIDAAPSGPVEGINQNQFIDSEAMVKTILGDKYIPREQLIQEFGKDYKDKWDKIVEKYPEALFMAFVNKYLAHGEDVLETMKKIWEKAGYKTGNIDMHPLQSLLDQVSVSKAVDKNGNEGIYIQFDPQRIIRLLRNDTNHIVNGSFQVGEVGIFKQTKKMTETVGEIPLDMDMSFSDDDGNRYPGAVGTSLNSEGKMIYVDAKGEKVNPVSPKEFEERQLKEGKVREVTKTSLYIEGAYTKEKALQNLRSLFEVCHAYPDKLFVFAAGNEGEDLREALHQLGEEKPKNVLLVAQWSKGEYNGTAVQVPTHGVQGADIYVNNAELGLYNGNSFSTSTVSAIAAELFDKGYTLNQVRDKILVATDTVSYTIPSPLVQQPQEALVFNPEKFQITLNKQ